MRNVINQESHELLEVNLDGTMFCKIYSLFLATTKLIEVRQKDSSNSSGVWSLLLNIYGVRKQE